MRPPPRKQEILRAVYEANRDGADAQPPPPPPRAGPLRPPRRGAGTVALVGLLGVALLGMAWGAVRFARPEPTADPPVPVVAALEPSAPLPSLRSGGAGVADVMDLRVRTIVIDAGHGGRDPGAVGPHGLREKDVTLAVARRLRDRLARHGAFRLVMTREGDRAIGLKERVALAGRAGADLFVSVHVNALADTSLAPVETYYFGTETDPAGRALAHAENGGGSFTVSEFNAALRRAGTAVKLQESRRLAQAVQDALVEERALGPRAARESGAKTAPFAVLLHTEAPAVLAEITALSNPTEEARLQTAAYRDAIAAALEAGVLAYLRPSSPADAPDLRDADPQ